MQAAQRVLTQFQQHPNSWTRVTQIMAQSKNFNAKYIALQVLEKVVQFKWKILPPQEREGIKVFIVGMVINCSKDERILGQQKVFMNKLNEVLVQVRKLSTIAINFKVRLSSKNGHITGEILYLTLFSQAKQTKICVRTT